MPTSTAARGAACVLLYFAFFAPLPARESGLPIATTGSFGERSCDQAGCHRAAPLNTGNSAAVSIEVGPYVPGATQEVRVIIVSRSANRWGFQLTARPESDPARPAGRFAPRNFFSAVRCIDGRLDASRACAEDEPVYVAHTSVGTQPGGQPGRKVFAFDWTSPAADVGRVVFAASALAADGDKGTNNDITARAQTVSLFAPTNSPELTGALHAAALQSEDQAVSSKMLLTLFGRNLNAPGAFFPVTRDDFDPQGLLPTELRRLSVVFLVPGDVRQRRGRIIFVGDTQVNLESPELPAGTETVRMQAVINRGRGGNEIRSNLIEINVRPLAPGLFTLDSTGRGEAAAVLARNGRIISGRGEIPNSLRARPGDVILVFGTGFGATDPDFAEGELASGIAPLISNVVVEIGGVGLTPREMLFAGAAPGFAALVQFNLRVPPLPPGDHAIFIRAGLFVTQPGVTLAVGE